jgi:hypothetical protein
MKVWLSRVWQRLAFWVPGIGLVWAGRATHSTPVLIVGAAALLASILPWPRSAETYRNRAFRIGNRWAEAVREAHRELQQVHERRRRKLASLTVASPSADAHHHLLSLEEDRTSRNRSLVERTQAWIERQAAVERELAMLQAKASNDEQRSYVRLIEEHLFSSKDDYARMVADTELAQCEAIARLEQLHVPPRIATQHTELCHAYRNQFVAWNSYHQAVQASNLDEALRAVADVDATKAVIHSCHTAINYATRSWPISHWRERQGAVDDRRVNS